MSCFQNRLLLLLFIYFYSKINKNYLDWGLSNPWKVSGEDLLWHHQVMAGSPNRWGDYYGLA